MTQLVQPNLSVVGYPDYCLAYVEQVFGVHNDPDPDAWQGWQNTEFKHTGPVPTNVSVPVWFSWTGTIGGITQNWGHVAVSTPNGVYTNPLSGSGHNTFASVPALASAYGVQYVGWSEDIGNLKVIGADMPITEDQLYMLIRGVAQREPSLAEASNAAYLNDPGLAIDTFWNNGGKAAYYATHNTDGTPKATPVATILAPGNYEVK